MTTNCHALSQSMANQVGIGDGGLTTCTATRPFLAPRGPRSSDMKTEPIAGGHRQSFSCSLAKGKVVVRDQEILGVSPWLGGLVHDPTDELDEVAY